MNLSRSKAWSWRGRFRAVLRECWFVLMHAKLRSSEWLKYQSDEPRQWFTALIDVSMTSDIQRRDRFASALCGQILVFHTGWEAAGKRKRCSCWRWRKPTWCLLCFHLAGCDWIIKNLWAVLQFFRNAFVCIKVKCNLIHPYISSIFRI